MSQSQSQYLRQCRLRLGPAAGGEGIDLSEMRIKFRMTARVQMAEPNVLEAYIYNLSQSTVQKLMAMPIVPTGTAPSVQTSQSQTASSASGIQQGDQLIPSPDNVGPAQVILEAGYPSNFGTIFKGQLFQVRRGRESPMDDFVIINAADGDWGHRWGYVNTTVGAGWTPEDIAKQAALAMVPYGISGDVTMPSEVTPQAAPRGKPMFSMGRDVLHDLSRAQRMHWWIEQGSINFLSYDAFKEGEVVVIKSNTGMVGLPQQTNFGVTVQCLLNPAVHCGAVIQIDNASVQRAAFQASAATGANQNILLANNLDADGRYKVLTADHIGDTRGNEWYTVIEAVSINEKNIGRTATPQKSSVTGQSSLSSP